MMPFEKGKGDPFMSLLVKFFSACSGKLNVKASTNSRPFPNSGGWGEWGGFQRKIVLKT